MDRSLKIDVERRFPGAPLIRARAELPLSEAGWAAQVDLVGADSEAPEVCVAGTLVDSAAVAVHLQTPGFLDSAAEALAAVNSVVAVD